MISNNNQLIKPSNYINNHIDNLLCIHGWGFNSNIWQETIKHLHTEYNLFTLDLNGHGNNDYNKAFENLDCYTDHLADNLSLLLKHQAQKKISILGWSLGGIIGLVLKGKHPELIDNVILCSSNPCFLSHNKWPYGIESRIWQNFKNNLLTNTENALKEFLLLQTLTHPQQKLIFKQLCDNLNQSKLASQQGLRWGLNILENDYRALFNRIDNSCIKYILGLKDKLVNYNISNWLTEKHPKIQVLQLKKSGHIPFITEPELFYNFLHQSLK